MIEVKNITFMYPLSLAPILKGFTSQFERGEITAISGKNGCGKTTLTKLLVGILRPSEGLVAIDGADTSGMTLFDIGRRAGYVFQNPSRQLFCDTAYNEVSYGLRNLGLDEIRIAQEANKYLELFDLVRHHDTYPGKLSIGEKQRLALASVFALGADYLVLDEPTTGLDARHRQKLGELLITLRNEHNTGIVLVSHSSDFIASFADRELVMR